MKICTLCNGSVEVIKDKPYEYTESGLDVVLYGITQYQCTSCGETFAALPKIQDLHKVIGKDICANKKALLKPEEIIFLRKNMHLKVKDMAKILGVNPSIYSRWENGKKTISDPYDRLLRMVYMACTAERSDCNDALTVNLFKNLSSRRKEIEQPSQIILNPQEWLLGDVTACGVS